ncbi:MAG: AAA family ATPase, partial [Butyrivibrio sp.]|nr:AAA family ATPase [Butyrivibrio sp.]
SGKLVIYQDCVYRKKTAEAEDRLAKRVKDMLRQKKSFAVPGLKAEIEAEEKELGVTFAEEQKEAVYTALASSLCVITGGPGTGKTMIQRAILDIYQKLFPKHEIVCCAPTGRAARRMEQSTGFPSSTVHKALNLFAGEDGCYGEGTELEADLILVDEMSMLDMYVADSLFQAVKKGSRLVLVGDADQLPSVGPGAVLGELIASGCIPVVRLDHVFRQKEGSRIAANAKQIRHGNASLEYGEDFQFVECADLEESARLIRKLYLQEVAKHGVDHVALLSPYRQKTETGVNALNEQIRDAVNPLRGAEIASGNRKFRIGDKVMQVKNKDDVSNGDIGYIRNISKNGNEAEIRIDFGDGRVKDYDAGGMELLDLGYASTIHKSQGSEYQTVIINIQKAHYIMLNRPLIYTAVTRGKKKVILVGEKKALHMAVKRTETEKRGTNLAARIREYMNH